MNRDKFLKDITSMAISDSIVSEIAAAYGCSLPQDVSQVLSVNKDGCFVEGGAFRRLLSTDEILHASAELHVDFTRHGILPLFDVGDNNFIVYDYKQGKWKKFNIVDETPFGVKSSLQDIL